MQTFTIRSAAIAIAVTLALGGCATTSDDLEWRPVELENRAINFDPASFDMNESVYTATDISFVQRYEYGVWRAEGGAAKTFVAELLRSRPGGNYAFSTPTQPLREMVSEEMDEPPTSYGKPGTLNARFGEVETLPYQHSGGQHCIAYRWFGWGLGAHIEMRDGGKALGIARLEAFYCQAGDSPVSGAMQAKVLNAVTLRNIGYK